MNRSRVNRTYTTGIREALRWVPNPSVEVRVFPKKPLRVGDIKGMMERREEKGTF